SVDGSITSGSIAGGTLTFSGTATLDMGDGPPPTGGLSLTGTLTATGITLPVGGSALPALPKTDGFTVMEKSLQPYRERVYPYRGPQGPRHPRIAACVLYRGEREVARDPKRPGRGRAQAPARVGW